MINRVSVAEAETRAADSAKLVVVNLVIMVCLVRVIDFHKVSH